MKREASLVPRQKSPDDPIATNARGRPVRFSDDENSRTRGVPAGIPSAPDFGGLGEVQKFTISKEAGHGPVEQFSSDDYLIERIPAGLRTPPSDSELDVRTDKPVVPDKKDTAEKIPVKNAVNELPEKSTDEQKPSGPTYKGRYHFANVFLDHSKAFLYRSFKNFIVCLEVFVMGVILLHLGAYISPGSTCDFVEPYTPEALSAFSPCSSREYIIPKPDHLFKQAVHQSSSLAKLRGMASKGDNLPSQITKTRHEFRKLLMELRVGTADASSVASLYSLVPEYNELLDKVVDGMHDCRAKTRSLVDDAIIYTDWTNTALRTIESRNNSLTALIYYRKWWPYEKSFAEMEVEKAFDEFTVKMENLAGDVYSKYVDLGRDLKMFERKLESIALALNMGRGAFERARLAEKSFWKELIGLQSYRQHMGDIERKAELCSGFYKSALEALKVVDTTTLALSEARAGIRHLREQVGKATLPRGKEWSLKLTIGLLENSVAELQASKSYQIGYL
ncbi:hypothetical protein TWF718_008592 [Orbilia javanica]|uniref:Uncharacterized protein n=1 Tax=Orbilia javanica TaxID=47235 RepID=A0AAN8RGC3_9PEZI